jgi:hypothetical protein
MRFEFFKTVDRKKDLLLLLSNLYLFALGLGWVIFHLYIRLVLERPSYTFTEIREQISLRLLVVFWIFILIQLLILFLAIFLIVRRNKSLNPTSIFYKASSFLNSLLTKIYWQPLEYLHDLVAPHIPGSGRFFLYLEPKWKTKRFTYVMITVFDIVPKLILAITFFLETIYYQRLALFFYILPLILIPILFSIFLKLFYSFAVRNAPFIQEYFESITGIGEPLYDTLGDIVGYHQYECIVKPEYASVIDPNEEMAILLQLKRICDIVVFTKQTLSTCSPYLLFTTSLLYLSGGLFRLLYIY